MLPKKTSKPERRRMVFLTARAVFFGDNAQIRDRSAVKTVLQRHTATFQQAIQDFGSNIVVDIIASLLENRIFESELKAKLAFPELYQVSAVRNLQHDASEQDAARSEAEALEEISEPEVDVDGLDLDATKTELADPNTFEEPLRNLPIDLPSLFPSYLSYQVQHSLLNTVQGLLEDCCYEWAAKWIPNVLEERNWTCAEAVELGRWSQVIPQRFGKLSIDATRLDSREALAQVLQATHSLRHAAVHRLPTSGKGIEKMLNNALALVKALNDTGRIFKMEDVLKQLQARMRDMELHKNQLENELDEELRSIQEQRAALDLREKEAKINMVRQDRKNTSDISYLFGKSLGNLRSDDPATTFGMFPEDPEKESVAGSPKDISGLDGTEVGSADTRCDNMENSALDHSERAQKGAGSSESEQHDGLEDQKNGAFQSAPEETNGLE